MNALLTLDRARTVVVTVDMQRDYLDLEVASSPVAADEAERVLKHSPFSTSNRGYKTVVVSDCVASMRGKDNHWMALQLMSRSIAWVLTVEELKDKLR
ncbi:MAG: isochorismatase family protein [Candidatus Rokubacteria bacterium]|nr:isochorismatase family protein [Candidatus Rokubacteria bacterium]